jgi:hypothetical protein
MESRRNGDSSLSLLLNKKKAFSVCGHVFCLLDTVSNCGRNQVSDAGDFDDGIYREQVSSGMLSRLIGRGSNQPHEKATFTTADIVFQGYLYKRGSWFKSW